MNAIWKHFKGEIILAPIVLALMTFFYGVQNGLLATAILAILEISVLIIAIVATMVAFHPISRAAFWLMVPYLAWVTFATALTISIALVN